MLDSDHLRPLVATMPPTVPLVCFGIEEIYGMPFMSNQIYFIVFNCWNYNRNAIL
jgi:hypothetical protein